MPHIKPTFQVNPVHILIFFAILFIVLIPMRLRLLQFGLGHMAGLFLCMSLVSGALLAEMLRSSSPNLIDYNGTRKSRAAADSMLVTSDDEAIPGMAIISYNGVRAFNLVYADNSLLAVPASAVEQLNDSTLLVYSPAVPLRRAEAFSGLFPAEFDILSKSQDVAFNPKKKRSEVRVSILNTLLRSPTPEDLRRQQLFTDRSAMMHAKDRDIVTDPDANIKYLRSLAASVRKDSLWSSFKNFFSGHDEDRPPERPGGGE